jgi:hypothetical protein
MKENGKHIPRLINAVRTKPIKHYFIFRSFDIEQRGLTGNYAGKIVIFKKKRNQF